jgi:hypothetical protein
MKPAWIKYFLLLLIPALLFIQLFQSGCANIVPPEGGLKDTLAPILTKVTPPNNSRNFADNRITFSFDEYVDLDNYQQNVIVSPVPKNFPTISRKLNTVMVRLRDTLEANTTYSINFGNAVKDVNEGNIIKDFIYTFSTGTYIDSLRFNGRVVLAETGEVDTTLTIMLHTTPEDSALLNKQPRYVTKTDGRGNFVFRNLPPDTFYVYALKDEGGSYRYTTTEQLFAFYDTAIVTSAETRPVILYAYSFKKEETTKPRVPGDRNRQDDKRLRYQSNLDAGLQDLLKQFVLTFEKPLRTYDSSKILVSTDSTFTPLTGYRWETDSTMKKLTFVYNWKEKTQYNIILKKDFATDTLDQQLLKDDTLTFNTKARADYGRLAIRFRNLDLSKNPVLLMVQGTDLRQSFPLTAATFSVPLIDPGEYTLRILYDTNKNGRWDPGDFFKNRKQPELVKPVPRKVNVRPNWDNQFEIAL